MIESPRVCDCCGMKSQDLHGVPYVERRMCSGCIAGVTDFIDSHKSGSAGNTGQAREYHGWGERYVRQVAEFDPVNAVGERDVLMRIDACRAKIAQWDAEDREVAPEWLHLVDGLREQADDMERQWPVPVAAVARANVIRDGADRIEQLEAMVNRAVIGQPDAVEALRLTVEYVGLELLPAEPGWSWFEVLRHEPWFPNWLEGMPGSQPPTLYRRTDTEDHPANCSGEHTTDTYQDCILTPDGRTAARVSADRIEQLETDRLMDAMDTAWGILANVSGGNWGIQTPEWEQAAERWRDEMWHPALDRNGHPSPEDDDRADGPAPNADPRLLVFPDGRVAVAAQDMKVGDVVGGRTVVTTDLGTTDVKPGMTVETVRIGFTHPGVGKSAEIHNHGTLVLLDSAADGE